MPIAPIIYGKKVDNSLVVLLVSEVSSASFSSFVFIASLSTSSLLLLFEDGTVVISVVVRGVSGSDCDGSADEGDVVGDGAVFVVVVGDGVPAITSCVDEEGLLLVPVLIGVDGDGVPNITKFCVDEEGLLLFPVLLEVDGDGEPATTELCVDEEGLLLVPVLLEVDGDGEPATTEFCVEEEGLLLVPVSLEVDGDGVPATTEF